MFEKVSFDTFRKDLIRCGGKLSLDQVGEIYKNIRLPERATEFSAGYDFYSPIGLRIPAGANIRIPTGIKANLENLGGDTNKFLALYPRSSYGFNYGMRLMNTVGIIDQDYYDNLDNEGDIIVAFTASVDFQINMGDKFCQGVIQPYYVMNNNEVIDEIRSGGIGSTDIIPQLEHSSNTSSIKDE